MIRERASVLRYTYTAYIVTKWGSSSLTLFIPYILIQWKY